MRNFEITKREVLASISIIAVMILVGILISAKITERQMDRNEVYNKAVKIDSQETFSYGMRTNVGNAFVYGTLEALDPVSYPEIDGSYMYVEKIKKLWMTPLDILRCTIEMLNAYRESYLETKDKQDWWQMIQLLPSSYNQRRTVMLNYEVLANMYKSRRNHKLDEWHTFCDWIESLPYSELITGKGNSAPENSYCSGRR